MIMQFVTMKLDDNKFIINRKITNTIKPSNSEYASCTITVLQPMFCCKSGFIASGFSSFESPIMEHDVNNTDEDINGFIKAVFSK